MQVSFHGEVEDHVVIGGGAAVACGIDDSAEFLDMLSDTIYREKALAAVREPICNAWDAHINSGKTDIPLIITLADGKLTIQDFGPGIAPEKMHGIYCVYGRSTKKTDEAQTGGFGIGSKAPWAYSKHFTVTSAHNGTRTIYAMSKGSVENNGKPDMRPITSVACDQSGLTVTIPIKDGDERKFDKLVRSIIDQTPLRGDFKRVLIDVKVQDLTPEIYSCIPGWHIDGAFPAFPHPWTVPDHHHLCVLNGPLTEFIARPVLINVDDPAKPDMKAILAQIPDDVPVTTCGERAITTFTSYDFHRGVKATHPTRRLLVRLTETNTVLARNKPQKPSQGARK